MDVLPPFTQFPKEAAIIGRLLAGYGELEFDLCNCVAAAVFGEVTSAARVLFRVRGEEARIQIADALMRVNYVRAGLKDVYDETLRGLHWCRRIRNQFAHCHWTVRDGGLCFVLLEKVAKGDSAPLLLTHLSITEPLLAEQEAYFCYVQQCLWYLSREYQRRADARAVHDLLPPNGKAAPAAYAGEQREATRAKEKNPSTAPSRDGKV
jgi:hypothetical protein